MSGSAEPVETLVERVREALYFHEAEYGHDPEADSALTELEKRLEAAGRERDELENHRRDNEDFIGRQQAKILTAEARVAALEEALREADWIIQRLYDGGSWGTMESQRPSINTTMDFIAALRVEGDEERK